MAALTRGMAVDFGKYNIRVNCVCPGDIITQIDGQDVRDSETVKSIMSAKKPGDTVELTVVQQSLSGKIKTFTIKAQLAEDKGSLNSSSNNQQNQESESSDIQKLPFGR